MIHQQRVGRLNHEGTECAVGKWCQRLACVCAAGGHLEHVL